jgi:hypothetical protein
MRRNSQPVPSQTAADQVLVLNAGQLVSSDAALALTFKKYDLPAIEILGPVQLDF